MAQVITNENMLEFIEKRQVPEFKAPPQASPEEKAKMGELHVTETKVTAEPREVGKDGARDITTGKFVKADGEKAPKEETKVEEAGKPADDDDTSELSEAVKRKIDKIIAKKHRAMKEAEEFGADSYRQRLAAEQRAEQLQKEIEELKKSGSGPATAKDSEEPKPEDFKTVGEYTRALTKYEVAKAKREAQAEGQKAREQSQAEEVKKQADERAASFAKRQSDFMKTTPDYEDVVGEADFDFPNVGMQYMVESEYGPQLAYHFAKNPKDADRLRTLSPARIIAELGKLETKFEKQPEPADPAVAARSVSRAPAPITPLESKSMTPVEKDPAKMNFRELREYERQREAARRAGR